MAASIKVWFLAAALVLTFSLGGLVAPWPAAGAAPARAVAMQSLVEADWIDADRRFAEEGGENTAAVSPSTPEKPLSTADDAAGGCDGVKSGGVGFHTASKEQDPWWQVDLGSRVKLHRIVVYNRTDAPASRTSRLEIAVSAAPGEPFTVVHSQKGRPFYGVKEGRPLVVDLVPRSIEAQVVRLQVPGRCSFSLDEVEVYASADPGRNIALGCAADQKSLGPYSRRHGPALTEVQPLKSAALPVYSFEHIGQLLARGRHLLARLEATADASLLARGRAELDALAARAAQYKSAGTATADERRELYLAVRRVLRAIAFANPLLDIDRLLFIKRHDPAGLYHMVHQYYGFSAKPGGGIYVLNRPCSDHPTVTDLLEGRTVEAGRLRGSQLTGGCFLSPEVSFDGRTILFSYSQCQGEKPEWSPRASYHIFQANADGSGLRQLTDGPWNDFDPCYLPNGRIAIISERRGGYLRCGGSAPPWDSPTYTLHSMRADGSDIICLSYHETQEWQPSVDHNGMVVYTRWDYVDRDTNVAHHLWNCYPDGRDARSYHGNYPSKRESRPWMEMNARAVPGSNKLVAVAAAHHGHEFGSLVLVDYRREDDGAMSQVERLTPEVPLPEAEGGKSGVREKMVYGTPWPLSADDYLCVYGADAQNRGIYWIDRWGNRELLYRDPEISCLSPMPLAPRPQPPMVATGTMQAAEDRQAADVPTATIAVMNVYDSDFTWPADARVAALRVIQVLPKTTPPADEPRIGVATETNARAVLGTVPVYPDGSAYFEAPAGKLLYFQALDEQGMAIQSMRSGTYLHAGERLACQGCHERKHTAPRLPAAPPMALAGKPSTITPESEGSNPFSYPRLVQPVLERNCVECHRQKQAPDLTGVVAGPHGWTRSYSSLAKEYGFYFHVSNGAINSGIHGGSRTVPGQFGARASKLLSYLDERHYGVKLSADDFHRITLWLDANSEFYGAYEDIAAQARGELVRPALD